MINISDLITVVIPIYNREIYLRESIESVINQTHRNLEILLIDDGSTSNVLNICKYYERMDKRIRVFTQKNGGICVAMRNAVLQARGEYIARCDSDDINELDRYEKQLKYLKENDYDMVGCYIKCFGIGNKYNQVYLEGCVNKPIRTYENQEKRFLLGQPITGSTIFAKTKVLKELLPFGKEYSIIEDFYISILLHSKGKRISILEEQKLNYRVHKENLSLTGDSDLMKKHTEIAFKYMFKELILKSKNILIFRRSSEKQMIIDLLNKYFSSCMHKFKIITEDQLDHFIKKEARILLDDKNTLVFYGMSFKDFVTPLIESGRYSLYKNIFLSGH